MLIGQTFMRRGMVVLRDVSGEEVELIPQDVLDLMQWTYEHAPQLYSLTAHKPPIRALPRTLERLPRKEGE